MLSFAKSCKFEKKFIVSEKLNPSALHIFFKKIIAFHFEIV